MKLEKRSIGLILIIVMFLSTFASSLLQKFTSNPIENNDNNLPSERILNYLTESQRILAISNDFTIAYFNYTSQYDEVKSYLESLAFKHYFYLVENFSNERTLKVESIKGSREIKDPNLNQTIDILCQIMIDIPIECVMREIE